MEIEINEPTDDIPDKIDEQTKDLLDVLIKAHGGDLPNVIESVEVNEFEEGKYTLHMKQNDYGNAYGECLATHGWAIVGYHHHHTDGETIDTVTVRKIDNCDKYATIFGSLDAEGIEFGVKE